MFCKCSLISARFMLVFSDYKKKLREGHFLLTEQVTGVWPQAGRGSAATERSLALAQTSFKSRALATAWGRGGRCSEEV